MNDQQLDAEIVLQVMREKNAQLEFDNTILQAQLRQAHRENAQLKADSEKSEPEAEAELVEKDLVEVVK